MNKKLLKFIKHINNINCHMYFPKYTKKSIIFNNPWNKKINILKKKLNKIKKDIDDNFTNGQNDNNKSIEKLITIIDYDNIVNKIDVLILLSQSWDNLHNDLNHEKKNIENYFEYFFKKKKNFINASDILYDEYNLVKEYIEKILPYYKIQLSIYQKLKKKVSQKNKIIKRNYPKMMEEYYKFKIWLINNNNEFIQYLRMKTIKKILL